jgi:hypothetical protein
VRARRLARLGWTQVLLAAALLAACASGPPPPEWLKGSSSSYPDDRFAVGVAANVSADRAAEAALAAIEVQTKGETEGAQVVDTWNDTDNNQRWALAVLERQPLLDSLGAELAAANSSIARALAAAETDAPHTALSDVAAAIALVPARDRLRERIANLGGTPPDADDSAHELDAKLAELKSQLRIEVSSWEMDAKTGAPGEALDENRRALTQRVIAMGFSAASADAAWGSDPIWLRVESKVAIERLFLHPDDELVAVHWDAAVEITDHTADGDVVAVLTEEGRAVHLSEAEARRQADADARDFAAGALEGWLNTRTSGAP